MSKKLLLTLTAIIAFGFIIKAQNVNIPDANFKAYLVGNAAINTNGDTEIQVSEANAFTGAISCNQLSLWSISGIEAFTSLTELYVFQNTLFGMNLSQNTALERLDCGNNDINSLDLSNNTALRYLNCGENNISSLDLSNNTALEDLSCQWNNLTTLDLSANTTLTMLNCGQNNISSLDLVNLTALTSLNVINNNISTLDVSNNTLLTSLYVDQNNLTELDLSSNTTLDEVGCSDNSLTDLNVANGNNGNISFFYAINNPSLSCIQVDDVTYSTNFWTNIDAGASFSLNCGTPCTVNIPDANFKAYLVGNAGINTNGNTEIECSEANNFTGSILTNNLSIADMTGLEAFTELKYLKCAQNQLTTLDVSNNVHLEEIWCFDNSITSLDISTNTALTDLRCGSNQLTNLYVNNNIDLVTLACSGNQITTLDLSDNAELEHLSCDYNQLTSLDLRYNVSLTDLYCYSNQLFGLVLTNGNNVNIANFDTRQNPNLACIEVDDEAYSTANWTNIDPASSFSTNCNAVLVSSISVQGQGGVSTITTNGGTLQMEAAVLPMNADDMTYTWSVTNGTGAAVIDAAGLLTATADGTVEVTATANDASGTVGTKTITISNQSVGINDLTFKNVNIYPNPTNGIINLDISEDLSSIKIMDLTGKTIQVFNVDKNQLDISGLNTGVYFLEISNAEKKSVMKIIKK